ncbi:PAS domain S-box protein [Rhodoflexus sp.]
MTDNDIERLLPEYLLRSETYSLVITDLEGRYIYVNNLFKNRFSFICENFTGQPFFISIYPEDHNKCLKAVEQVLQNPDKVVKVNLRKPDTNLSDFYWTEWEFSLFKNQDKNPIGILCLGHDITESEKASIQAKAFAKKIDAIIEEITDGFYVLNREWEFVKINKVAEQILGVPREKLLGHKIWDLFPDTPDYKYPTQFRKAMSEYVTVTFEDYRADLDRWFSVVCYPLQEGLTIFFKDITQTKKQIEKITQQEHMLRAIYQSTTEASTFIDRDFIIRYTNQVAKYITKQTFGREIQIGDNSLDYYLPAYREEFRTYYEKVLSGESFVLERKDGTNWWQISLFPVYDEEQNIIGIANNVQDITDRKQKEILLEETKIRLDSTIEAIPHTLLIVDENNRIVYVNTEFENVFGYLAEEVIGREIDFLLPERYRAGHKFLQQKYLQKGGAVKKMGRYLQALIKSGIEIFIDASLNTFVVNGKKYVIVILQDVTEQKKYQDTIVQQNETLKQIAWQQSHELRRPVASILGLCDLLKNYPNETEEMKHKYVDYMLQATKELDKIIHKIVSQANESAYLNNE